MTDPTISAGQSLNAFDFFEFARSAFEE